MSHEAERAALRDRQGGGARYDAKAAPHVDLSQARLASAAFARSLANLSDTDLDCDGSHGRPRRTVIAFIGYQARHMAETVAFVRAGAAGPTPLGLMPSTEELQGGATLPAQALRHLAKHAAIHLDVEWRDAGDRDWGATVMDATGTTILLRDMPSIRAISLWHASLDLDAGARLVDVPLDLCGRVEQAMAG